MIETDVTDERGRKHTITCGWLSESSRFHLSVVSHHHEGNLRRTWDVTDALEEDDLDDFLAVQEVFWAFYPELQPPKGFWSRCLRSRP